MPKQSLSTNIRAPFSDQTRRLFWLQMPVAKACAQFSVALNAKRHDADLRAVCYGFADAEWLAQQFCGSCTVAHAWPAAATSSQLTSVLGGAYDILIFNAWAGFHPDRLALLSGTIRGGGFIVIVSPPAAEWPKYDDPEYQRLISDVRGDQNVGREKEVLTRPGHYLRYVVNCLQAGVGQAGVVQGAVALANERFKPTAQYQSTRHIPAEPLPTQDQKQIVDALLKVILSALQQPDLDAPICLVGGARGRGKSQVIAYLLEALWAHVSAEMLSQESADKRDSASACDGVVGQRVSGQYGCGLRVAAIVPHPSAITTLKHYKPLQEKLAASELKSPNAALSLDYYTPTAWLNADATETAPLADLMVVEEAASLPLTVIQDLMRFAGPVILVTTTIGYEGSGRVLAEGFVHWLMAQQTRAARGFLRWYLTAPLRWSSSDCVEPFLNKLLLLDAKLAQTQLLDVMPGVQDKAGNFSNAETFLSDTSSDHLSHNASEYASYNPACSDPLTLTWLTQRDLVDAPQVLESLWALLYGAHYRTRPSDLRALLDQPGVAIVVTHEKGVLMGAGWFVEEGPFSEPLADNIMANRRRPKGHLLPQLLALRFGDVEALQARYLRCVRIAVAPAHRRQSVARKMLAAAYEKFSDRVAALGASCALQPDTAYFWQHCGYQLLRLGVKPNARSGAVNFAVIAPCSARARAWVLAHQGVFWSQWSLMKTRFVFDAVADLVEPFRQRAETACDNTTTQEDTAAQQRWLNVLKRDRLMAFARSTAEEVDVAGLLDALVQLPAFWSEPEGDMSVTEWPTAAQRAALVARVCEGTSWPTVARQGKFSSRKQGLACLRRVLLCYLNTQKH